MDSTKKNSLDMETELQNRGDQNRLTSDNNSSQSVISNQPNGSSVESGYPPGWKEKINVLLDLKQKRVASFNEQLLSHRDFKNPGLYKPMIESFGLNERGSSDPNPLFGSHNPEFPYDALYDIRSQIQLDRAKETTGKAEPKAASKVTDTRPILQQDIFNRATKNEPSSIETHSRKRKKQQ